jgi:hypothetical protein
MNTAEPLEMNMQTGLCWSWGSNSFLQDHHRKGGWDWAGTASLKPFWWRKYFVTNGFRYRIPH